MSFRHNTGIPIVKSAIGAKEGKEAKGAAEGGKPTLIIVDGARTINGGSTGGETDSQDSH
jgi:hypothetical protein